METTTTPLPAVTAAEFREARHLPEDTDGAFEAVLAAAEEVVTRGSGQPLTPRTMRFVVPVTGWRRWWFPVKPVSALTQVEALDEAGQWIVQDIADARLAYDFDEPQLFLPDGWAGWADEPDQLRVTAEVGHNGSAPTGLRQAIILQAAEFYAAQIAVDEVVTNQINFGVERLIRQSRYLRPCVFGLE